MSGYLLDSYPASSTIYCVFDSFAAATGAPATISNFAVGDILIYKNGSTTQRSSTSGFTLLDTDGIDFDALTGINGFSVDLSDNTDAGFYAVGSQYSVVVGPITIDGQTVQFVCGTFRIVAAEGVAGKPKVDVDAFGGSAGTFSGGRPEVNTTHAAGTAWGSGAITAASIAADAITAAKIADGAIDAATFAANAITASALASDAITDAKVAADVTIASVTGSVGSVSGNVGGSVGSLAAQAKADVNAEVVDALATDTYAEPGQGAPAATAALSTKISFLYKAWRNKVTQTSTTYSLFADDAATVDQKATVSDDATTFTKGEVATGP